MKARTGRLNVTQFLDSSRVFKIATVKEDKRPYRLMIEKWAIGQARILGVNTPEVLDYSTNQKRQEVLTLKYINGQNIRHFSLNEKCESLNSVGRQMKLLRAPIKGFGWINLSSQCGTSNDWKSFLYSYAETYGNNVVKEEIISRDDLHLILKLLADMSFDIQTPFLVNRDIKPGNIIRDIEGKTWIIDWENTILGDPLYDLAVFGGSYGHGKLWENLLNGYGFILSPLKYNIYQAIALFGSIDFCIKYGAPFRFRHKRLKKIVTNFREI